MVAFAKKRARHLQLGSYGEKIACRLLQTKCYRILARNYRCYAGEIDIIARDGATLAFIEVKTRYITTRSRPARGLRLKQQHRIYRAGRHYINSIDNFRPVMRFDLIEIIVGPYGVVELRHWLNHFSASTLFPPHRAGEHKWR